MDIELLKAGSLIMVIGMGFVFFFLFLMICFMEIVSKLVAIFNKYFPEEIEEANSQPKKLQNNDAEIALAIACAALKQKKVY